MTKAELISAIAEQTNFTKKDTGACVEALLDVIANALAEGDSVAITGFGKFSVSERAARTGRNPQTGEPIEIEAKRAPKFSAGKSLKDIVNE